MAYPIPFEICHTLRTPLAPGFFYKKTIYYQWVGRGLAEHPPAFVKIT